MTSRRTSGRLQLGDFARRTPISQDCGGERGTPVDRYYSNRFLASHASDIAGRVLELGDGDNAGRLGGNRVESATVLPTGPDTSVGAALDELVASHRETFNCILLPQQLHRLGDVAVAIRLVHALLAPGGIVLATIPGIGPADPGDAHLASFGFTLRSARQAFSEVFSGTCVSATAEGNVLSSLTLMHGLASSELTDEELSHRDPDYDVMLGVRAWRPVAD